MPRELRLDYAGNSYRWFDVDEMLRVHGGTLTRTLTQDIEQHFQVSASHQVLCDVEGPLTSQADLRRVLLGVAPRLWLFDIRYVGENLRKQCEQRGRIQCEDLCPELDKATATPRSQGSPESCSDAQTQTEPRAGTPRKRWRPRKELEGMRRLESLGRPEVQQELHFLKEREQKVAKMLSDQEAEIRELKGLLLSSSDSGSQDLDEASLQVLEAEEAMLVQSVQDALSKIGHRADGAHRTFTPWQADAQDRTLREAGFGFEMNHKADEAATPSLQRLSSTTTTASRQEWPPSKLVSRSSSGPLPPSDRPGSEVRCQHCGRSSGPDGHFCQYCGKRLEQPATARDKDAQLAQEEAKVARHKEELRLEQALALAHEKQQELLQSQARVREDATQAQTELGRTEQRCKQLEMEVALRNKDLQHAQEWRELQNHMHTAELHHQAEVLQLQHRAAACAEQEEWQQMEILMQTSQRKHAEKVQEQEVQDLMLSVELERLVGSELRAQSSAGSAKATERLKDLNARLAGRDLEILALENAIEGHRSRPKVEDLQRAEGESAALAQQLQRRAEELQAVREEAAEAEEVRRREVEANEALRLEEASEAMHGSELTRRLKEAEEARKDLELQQEKFLQRSQEVSEFAAREAALVQRVAQLESQLEELSRRPEPPKEVDVPPEPSNSDYVSTADDELDKMLEKQISEMGPGILKGNTLERIRDKQYKLSGKRVAMQLSDGGVEVRVDGNYIPLGHWVRELMAPGEKGSDDAFSFLDAHSQFAAVR
ncbi:unnamed protein product [Effrenium voratum]|uniref:Uncharacterized protein n=1 Tax=Effrenium voratum TaxID=2562239 RepID=A0AA36JJI7_9DINO|nr:unnamed protein product [Effrenium voratum]CAJ1427587.1 unnamed protein product [Effrenium voratum]